VTKGGRGLCRREGEARPESEAAANGVGSLPEQMPIIESIRHGGRRMASLGGCGDTTSLKKSP
jgi:hypothetical protein